MGRKLGTKLSNIFGLAPKSLGLALGVLAISVSPTLAQDANASASQVGDHLVIEAHEHRFTTTLPAWFGAGEGSNLSDQELIISGDQNSTRFEIVPKGQNPDQWSHMYGVRIVLEPERDLTTYRQAAAYGYALSCDGTTGDFFLADQDSESATAPMVFVCGRFVVDALRPGEGEIMAMAFARTEQALVVVYEEYRTPSFDGKDQADWPIAGTAMIERARQLAAAVQFTALDS